MFQYLIHRMPLTAWTQLVGCLFSIVGLSFSAQASDFHSPRTAALGGSGHAGPLLNDAIYLNPSFASFLPTYSIGANYQFFSGGPTDPDGYPAINEKLWNVSIQDGRSEMFQAGVGFTQRDNGRMLNVGASKTIVQRLGVGVGGKFYFPNENSQTRTSDMILSSTLIAQDWLYVVGVIDNLFETAQGKVQQQLYREYLIGTKFNISGLLLIYLDPHLAPNVPDAPSFGIEAGAELPVFNDFLLRAGIFRNSKYPQILKRGHGYGMGVAWVAPRISLDYGMSQLSEPVAVTTHTLGFTVYF